MKPFWQCVLLVLALTGPGRVLAQAAHPPLITGPALVTENVPRPTAQSLAAIKRYQDIARYGFHGWLRGGVLVSARQGQTTQAFWLKSPGARTLTPLSRFAGPVRALVVSPDGRSIILSHDHNGDERYQGVLLDGDGKNPVVFTEPGFRNTRFVFSRDSRWIAWQRASSDKPGRDIMLATRADPSGTRRIIGHGEGVLLPLDISPDNTTVLVSHYLSVSESRLFLLDIATGALRPLNPHPWPIAYGRGQFSPDGKSVIVQSDEGRAFVGLIRLDVQGGPPKALSPALKGDITGFALSADGHSLAYVADIDAISHVLIADAKTGKVLAAPKLPMGVVGALAFDSKAQRLGFTLDGARYPAGVWVYARHSGSLRQWTGHLARRTEPDHFRRPRRVSYSSFAEANGRRRKIPAFLYMPPKNFRRPVPVVVFIHGGPEARFQPYFSPQIQFWVQQLGVAVIAPNIRGSAGFGGDYVGLDNGVHREDALKDIGALLDWIVRQKRLDARRVIAYGGSYGGYMVLASLARYRKRFIGGMDLVGITDFVDFLENTGGYRKILRRVEYGDERQPVMRAFLEAISPVHHAAAISAPVFIVHGQNDPRVPVRQSLRMVAALKTSGAVPVWFMLAKNEGHGFSRRENVLALRAAENDFVRFCLARPQ